MHSDDFLSNVLRRKALHVTCSNTGQEEEHARARVTELRQEMFGLDPGMILNETSSDSIFLWLRDKDGNTANSVDNLDLIRSIEISDADTALALHRTGGHATYCRAPPKVEQCLVSNLLRSTGLGCGQYDPAGDSMTAMARGEVETFISTKGHMTNWHFDFQENFTIQLSGTKRWTLQQGTIRDPIRGCTPHYAAPGAVESQLKAAALYDRKFRFGYPEKGVTAIGDPQSILVKPGDVLYFPAGMWHKVEAVEPGVSINVSLMASNYASVTCQALQHLLLTTDPKWREPILQNPVHSAVDHLKTLLKELPDKLKEFEGIHNGAEAVLPPIVRSPPAFQMVDDGDEDWQEVAEKEGNENSSDAMDHNDGEDDVVEEVDDDQSSEEPADAENGEGREEEDDDDNDDNILSPLHFDDYPQDWEFESLSSTTEGPKRKRSFYRNPLATLHRLSEMESFYSSENMKNRKQKQQEYADTFVLNVNYAGNEMHESTVRILVRCDDESSPDAILLQRIQDLGPSESLEWSISSENSDADDDSSSTVVKFFVYHGLLVEANGIK